MTIQKRSDTQHVDGSAPLPDMIETTAQLVRLVDFLVIKGWNIWPLPAKMARHWQAPIQMGRRWLVGDAAKQWRWHLFLMGRIREQFSSNIQTIASGILLAKGGDQQGAMVLSSPIPLLDIMQYLESEGFLKKEARS